MKQVTGALMCIGSAVWGIGAVGAYFASGFNWYFISLAPALMSLLFLVDGCWRLFAAVELSERK